MANKIKGITVKIGGDTIDLQKSLKDVNKKSINLNSELTQINRQLRFDPSSAVLLSQKQKVLAESIETSKDKLKQLEDVQQDIERQYKSGDIDDGQYRAYQREVEQTKNKLKDYEGQLKHVGITQKEFDKKVEEARATLEKNKQSLKSGAKQFLTWGAAAGAAMTGAGAAAFKYAADYETAFAKVSTLLSKKVDLQAYKEDIIATSNEIGVAANDVAEATYSALSASVPEDKAVEFVKNAYKLKKAGFTELETSVDVLTTAMNAYGLSAKKTNHISDVLITTQNLGKTTVAELASKMGKVIPTAAAYGVALEELGTQYALLTKKGVNTANSTTQIKSMLNELSKAGSTADKSLKAIGEKKSFAELTKEGKNVIEVLEMMYKSVDGNNTAFGNMFGNNNAKAAALSLMATGAKEYNSVLKKMTKSEGTAEKAYKKMADTAEHKLEVIKTNIENSAITIGNGLLPAVSDVLEEVEKHLPEIQEMAEELGDKISDDVKWVIKNGGTIIKWIRGIAIEAGGIYAAVKAYNATKTIVTTIQALKTLKTATDAAKVAQLGLNAAEKANVIAAVVSGLVILGTTLYNVYQATNDNIKSTNSLNKQIEETTEKVKEARQEWENLEEERQKAIDTGMTEISHYEELYDELQQIVDQNGKVKKGYEERADFITDTLSEALGIEIKNTDGIITKYGELKDAIDEVIEKKKAQIILDAQESEYKTALENQSEAIENLTKNEEFYTKKLQEYQKACDEYEKSGGGALQKSNVDKLKTELDERDEAYKESLDVFNRYVYTIAQYDDNLAKFHAGKYDEMSKATWDYVKDYQGAGDAEKKMLEANISATETRLNYLNKFREKSNDERVDAQIATAEKELETYKNQLKQYTSSTENGLNSASVKWNKALDKQISDITGHNVEFKKAANGNVQMYVDGVKTGEPQTKKEMARLVSSAIKEVTKGKKKTELAGEDLIDGLNNGVKNQDKQKGVFATIANFGRKLLSKLKSSLKEHSPSKATEEMGVYLIRGISVGVKKEQKTANKQVESFGNNLLSAFDTLPEKAKKSVKNASKMALKTIAQLDVDQKKYQKIIANPNNVLSRINGIKKHDVNVDDVTARFGSQIEPYRQMLVKNNTSKVITHKPEVNVTFNGGIQVRNDQDINDIANRVSEVIAAQIEMEGVSNGE